MSSNISVIEEYLQSEETQYWVNYIETMYEYTIDNLDSIQNDTELINDITLYENDPSIVNKIKYKDIICDKMTSITTRFEGVAGISIVTASNEQICTGSISISANYLDTIAEDGLPEEVQLFLNTVIPGKDQEKEYILISKYEYSYVTINLYQETAYIGCLYIFLDEHTFWEELYDNGHFLITDESGNELVNTFGDEFQGYDENKIDTIILSNGWILKKGTEDFYLQEINKNLLIISAVALVFFIAVSFCISLFLFKKPFSGIVRLREFIACYHPADHKHDRLKTRQKNIRWKLVEYFAMSLIVPSLIMFTILSFWYNNQIENMIIGKYTNMVNSAADYISKIVDRKEAVFNSLLYDYDFQTYIFNREKYIEQYGESDINKVLPKYAELGLEGYDITIFNNQNQLLFTNSNYILSNFDNMVSSMETGTGSYVISEDELSQKNLSLYLDFGDIYSDNIQYHYRGRIDIALSELYDYCRNLDDTNSQIYITDEGVILFSDMVEYDLEFTSLEGVIKSGQTNTIIFYSKLGDTPLYLMLVYDLNFLTHEVRDYIVSFISIVIIIILFIFVIISNLSNIIHKPLLKLGGVLRNYNAFDDTAYIETTSNIKEVIDITEQFNNLLDRIDELYDELILSANEKNLVLTKMHKAELTALQSQINPHYLSNTLENLISLISNGQKEKAINVIKLINTQFRVGISKKNKTITIQEEIIYTKAYIEILKIRFGESIQFIWNVPDPIQDYYIIKLVLQPLIENAVKHGLGGREGCVTIDAELTENDILITVSDNGRGIDEKKLTAITERLLDNNYFGDHIGLYNVNWRLNLLYGNSYGITKITSTPHKGTRVCILFPIEVNPK